MAHIIFTNGRSLNVPAPAEAVLGSFHANRSGADSPGQVRENFVRFEADSATMYLNPSAVAMVLDDEDAAAMGFH